MNVVNHEHTRKGTKIRRKYSVWKSFLQLRNKPIQWNSDSHTRGRVRGGERERGINKVLREGVELREREREGVSWERKRGRMCVRVWRETEKEVFVCANVL